MKNKQVITKNNILSENTTIRAGPIMLNDSSHSTAHEAEKRLKLYIYLFQIQVVYWADTSYATKFNLVFCAKYDRGLDLGFWEILKP